MKVTVPAILALAALVASASGQCRDPSWGSDCCRDDLCCGAEIVCRAGCTLIPWSYQVCIAGCYELHEKCIKTVRGGKVDAPQSHKKDVKSQEPRPVGCRDLCFAAEEMCKKACSLGIFSRPTCDSGCTALYDKCLGGCDKSSPNSPTVRGGKVDAPQSHKEDVTSHIAKILEDALCGLPNHDANRAKLFCNKLKDEQK
jgi:hypothetical protein